MRFDTQSKAIISMSSSQKPYLLSSISACRKLISGSALIKYIW